MRFARKSGLAAVALLALSSPAFALNPQPEPPGVTHNPDQSVQSSNRTLTAPVSTTCGAASGAPNVVVGGTQAAGSMTAHALAGSAIDTGVSANVDKCAAHATSMGAAAPATPATH